MERYELDLVQLGRAEDNDASSNATREDVAETQDEPVPKRRRSSAEASYQSLVPISPSFQFTASPAAPSARVPSPTPRPSTSSAYSRSPSSSSSGGGQHFTFSPFSLTTAPISPPTDEAHSACASILRALNEKVRRAYRSDEREQQQRQAKLQALASKEQKGKKEGSSGNKRRREKSFWAELTTKKVQEAKAQQQQRQTRSGKHDKGKEREECKIESPTTEGGDCEAEVKLKTEEEGHTQAALGPTSTSTSTSATSAEEHTAEGRLRGGHVVQIVNVVAATSPSSSATSSSTNFEDENHLRLFAQATELMLAFDRLMWLFAPLHPSIIHEDNIRLALSARHDEPKDLANPLLLHVHAALAFGAFLLEARDLADEFFERARRQLEHVFDSTDYNIAEAMWCLGFYQFAKGQTNQSTYFTTLALQIGQRLQAHNSYFYGKCLLSAVLNPDFTLEEKARLVNEYAVKVTEMPLYYDKNRSLLIKNSTTLTFGTVRDRGMSTLFILNKARNLEKIIAECLLLHACWIKPDHTHSEDDRARIASDNALILSKYSQGLAMFRQELQNSADKFVDSFAATMVLIWLALNVQYYGLADNSKLALYWSLQFADKAKCLSIDICSPNVIAAYEIVFNFVVSAERLDVAEQILALPKLQRWTAVFPVCESRLRQLADRLAQELQARQTAAGPDLSRPSSSPDSSPDLGGGGAYDGGKSKGVPCAGRRPADDRGGDSSGGGGPDWSSCNYSAGKLADMAASSWGLEGDLDLAWLQWLN